MIFKGQYPAIDNRILAELDQLLEASSPGNFRKSIQLLLSFFLREAPNLDGKKNREAIENTGYLIEFLDNVSEVIDVKPEVG